MKYEEVTQPMSRMGFVIGFVMVTMCAWIILIQWVLHSLMIAIMEGILVKYIMNACNHLTMGLTIALVLVIGGNGGPKTIKG